MYAYLQLDTQYPFFINGKWSTMCKWRILKDVELKSEHDKMYEGIIVSSSDQVVYNKMKYVFFTDMGIINYKFYDTLQEVINEHFIDIL